MSNMATTQELLSLQRKIALDSYHQTIQKANKSQRRSLRPRSQSITDSSKPILKSLKSNKSTKSRSNDTTILQPKTTKLTSSHLPSMTKPFKKMFKRPKQQDNNNNNNNNNISDNYNNTYSHHTQSRSLSNPSKLKKLKKLKKCKPKPKHYSDSQLSVNIKKLIDKKLLQEYEEYVSERVKMLRSRAFPHEVIYQLSQYRTDLTNSLNKTIPNVYYSRHKFCDQLIAEDLLKAEKKALKQCTKLKQKSHKQSTLKTIKKGIVAPIKPIKNLFVSTNKIKTISPMTHYEKEYNHTNITNIKLEAPIIDNNIIGLNELISPNSNLEHKFNILPRQLSHNSMISDSNENEKSNSISNDLQSTNISISQMNENDTQLISSLSVHIKDNNNKMEIIKDDVNDDFLIEKEAMQPQFSVRSSQSQTVDIIPVNNKLNKKQTLVRAKTENLNENENENENGSATPEFFKMRTNNVRNSREDVFANNLRSNTPSWALKDSTSDVDTENVDMNETKNDMNDEFSEINELDLLETKYSELELFCQDLQINLTTMQKNISEQNNTIGLLTQQMNQMENKLNTIKCGNNNNDKSSNKNVNINVKENGVSNNYKYFGPYFDYKYFDYGYFWNIFKQKIEEKDIISFERTKWENIYHSLFAYFMNGLMVIFTILNMFIGFIFDYVLCCLCKKNVNHQYKRNNNNKDYKYNFSRNKKRLLQRRNSRNKNIWREINDEQGGDT